MKKESYRNGVHLYIERYMHDTVFKLYIFSFGRCVYLCVWQE